MHWNWGQSNMRETEMADENRRPAPAAHAAAVPPPPPGARKAESRMTGSLRDALAAVRGETRAAEPEAIDDARRIVDAAGAAQRPAAAAAVAANAGGDATQIIRAALKPPAMPQASRPDAPAGAAKTQFVRGKNKVERAGFAADPVVGWLVIVGGPGLGAYRPIFEGNNTIGRNASQRIPIDFGDDAISAEEQAYLRYDSTDRRFLFVPNLTKTNVVAVNNAKPTNAVALSAMDVITMGRTQLVFVPFCGDEFDWAELVASEG
jgi:hypothetical protein